MTRTTDRPTINGNRARARQWLTDLDYLKDDEHPAAARTIHHSAQRLARQRIETNRRVRRLLSEGA